MGFQDKIKEKYGGDPSAVPDAEEVYGGPNLDLPLKPGEYRVEIVGDNTGEQDTSSGGEMVTLDLKVLGPESADRRIFERYITGCPKNRDFESEQVDRLMSLYQTANGGEMPDTLDDYIGSKLVVRTGLEKDTYQGVTEYEATVWGVRADDPDDPPEGAYSDDQQPDIWEAAVAHAKSSDDDSSSASTSSNSVKTKEFDDDDLDF